jgi:hypothetical protein
MDTETGPNAGIITSIMQSSSAKTLTWHTLKEEREGSGIISRYSIMTRNSRRKRSCAVRLILIFLPSDFPQFRPNFRSYLAASVSRSRPVASICQRCSLSPCLRPRRLAAPQDLVTAVRRRQSGGRPVRHHSSSRAPRRAL